jgi:nucleotide-binding universal stress UspA family protein
MHTILLATDGSPSAQDATETALALAQATRWRLHVLSIWRRPVLPLDVPSDDGIAELALIERNRARVAAEQVAELGRSRGIQATAEIREGEAAEEICATAADCAAELIVLGAHGRGPVKRVFGSVSSRVVHDAPCPVVIARPDVEGAVAAGANGR